MSRPHRSVVGALRSRGRRAVGRLSGSLVRVSTDEPSVALTFDDGPDPDSTPRFLELLADHGAKATFFMVGDRAAAHRDLVERVVSEGHCIANHTWDHTALPALSHGERWKQLKRCAEALEPWGKPLFRPPRTLQTPASYATTRLAGLTVVAWSGNVEDWRPASAVALAERLRDVIKPGRIVLLHDTLRGPMREVAGDRGPLLEALNGVLSELDGSVVFDTIPALLGKGRPVLRPWFVPNDDAW